jgi:ABC-type sugar transport system ATPase subunit
MHATGETVPGWTLDGRRPPAVRAEGLTKRFGGVQALRGLDLTVQVGRVHAIVGENGAGKSTLLKILAGILQPDSGSLEFDGSPVHIASVRHAQSLGVGIVHQELRLFPARSVLANLFVGAEPTRRGLVSVALMRERCAKVIDQLQLDVDLSAPVGNLSLSDQQLVELARVLLEKPSLLILDEPTSALSERESQRLLSLVRNLPSTGTTVLYVSHRLEEVFQIAEDLSVVRDGRVVLGDQRDALTIPMVVDAMVGRALSAAAATKSRNVDTSLAATPPALSIRQLATYGQVRNVDLDVHAGEIVGIAGLVGSGADELLLALFGAVRVKAGKGTYPDGKSIPSSPTDAARRGVALVPADRRRFGVLLDRSIADNAAVVLVGALRDAPFVIRKRPLQAAGQRVIDRLGIKATPGTLVGQLSGGNQQKVVFGKWMETRPSLVLLDDPTRGVDIGAKTEIFEIVLQLATEGCAVLFRSTEIAELTAICDRVVVLRDGVSVASVRGADDAELLRIVNQGSATAALPN